MAESIVQVTEGTGKKLRTNSRAIGANTTEEEYVLLGENGVASFTIAPGGTASTATANSHLMQIMSGATNKVRIRRIEIYQVAMATAAAMMTLQIARLTTAGTGGTAVVPNPLDTVDAVGATSMLLPTVKGTESQLMWTGAVYMMQTIAASAPALNPILVVDFDRPRSKPLLIPAGTTNGIAIKNVTAIAAATVLIQVWFDETSFV